MRQDFTEPRSGLGDEVPTTDWAKALTEIRALVEKHGGHETVITDSQGQTCQIIFHKDAAAQN